MICDKPGVKDFVPAQNCSFLVKQNAMKHLF